jgi:hypothetical protein
MEMLLTVIKVENRFACQGFADAAWNPPEPLLYLVLQEKPV